MKESLKAALWSIFIFPGGGHFYLKKWISGGLMAVISVGALAVILTKVIERANKIAEKIILGEIPYDISVITEMVMQQSRLDGSPVLNYAWYTLIAVWVIAAADAYRLGRRVDRQMQADE